MRHISLDEFTSTFPRREVQLKIESLAPGDLTIDRDTHVTGIIRGGVVVKEGAQAQILGFVQGGVRVEAGAELYLQGAIQGDAEIEGSACISGFVNGSLTGTENAQICTPSGVEPELLHSARI